ncbi:MAG: hypothetical protein GX282_04310 [Campylobacteraceae bacterium]|nr:hypothetical protein [Campylobacteraceae bacterium]
MKKLFILFGAGVLSFLIIFVLWALYAASFQGLVEPAIYTLFFVFIWLSFMRFFYFLLDYGKYYQNSLIAFLVLSVVFVVYSYLKFKRIL